MENLLPLLAAYKDLGGEEDDRLNFLVTPFRRLLRRQRIHFKQAPLSISKIQPCELFIMNDLIIIATKEAELRNSEGVDGFTKSNKDEQMRCVFMIYLNRTSAKLISVSTQEKCGIQLLQVKREEHNTGQRGPKVVTRVDKVELWLDSKDERLEMIQEIQQAINDSKQIDPVSSVVGDNESDGGFSSATLTSNPRRWLSARFAKLSRPRSSSTGSSVTMDAQSQARSRRSRIGLSRSNTGDSSVSSRHRNTESFQEVIHAPQFADDEAVSTAGVMSVQPVSVEAEIMEHFPVQSVTGQTELMGNKLEAPEQQDKHTTGGSQNDDREKSTYDLDFQVVFDEGPMGFSLTSSLGLGVIVGRMAAESPADLAGVKLGDRLLAAGDVQFSTKSSWRDAVETVKNADRPICLTFRSFNGSILAGAKLTVAERAWARRLRERSSSLDCAPERVTNLEELWKSTFTRTGSEAEQVVETFEGRTDDNQDKTAKALLQFLTSEREYVEALRNGIRDYVIPLRRMHQRLNRDEEGNVEGTTQPYRCDTRVDGESLNVMFCNIDTLLAVNSCFMANLNKNIAQLAETKKQVSMFQIFLEFAKCMRELLPFLKLYSLYHNLYIAAIDKVNLCQTRDKQFREFTRECEAKSQVSLQAYLTKPIYRIQSYAILLQEILREILETARDKTDPCAREVLQVAMSLQGAMGRISDMSKSLNSHVGSEEDLKQLKQVYLELGGESVVPQLVQPSRKFLANFGVSCSDIEFSSTFNDMELYAFDDLVLLVKRQQPKRLSGSQKFLSNLSAAGSRSSLRRMSKSFLVSQRRESELSNTSEASSCERDLTSTIWLKVANLHLEQKGECCFTIQCASNKNDREQAGDAGVKRLTDRKLEVMCRDARQCEEIITLLSRSRCENTLKSRNM